MDSRTVARKLLCNLEDVAGLAKLGYVEQARFLAKMACVSFAMDCI